MSISQANNLSPGNMLASIHDGSFFDFSIKAALLRSKLSLAAELKDSELERFLDVSVSSLVGRLGLNQFDTYVKVLDRVQNSLSNPPYVDSNKVQNTLRELLDREHNIISTYLKESAQNSNIKTTTADKTLLSTILSLNTSPETQGLAIADLLYDMPEYLTESELQYVSALQKRYYDTENDTSIAGGPILKFNDKATINKFELEQIKTVVKKPNFTFKQAIKVALPNSAIAIVLGANQLLHPFITAGVLTAATAVIAAPMFLEHMYVDKLQAGRKGPKVLLQDAFRRIYTNAPSWEQISHPQTLTQRWMALSYFIMMHNFIVEDIPNFHDQDLEIIDKHDCSTVC